MELVSGSELQVEQATAHANTITDANTKTWVIKLPDVAVVAAVLLKPLTPTPPTLTPTTLTPPTLTLPRAEPSAPLNPKLEPRKAKRNHAEGRSTHGNPTRSSSNNSHAGGATIPTTMRAVHVQGQCKAPDFKPCVTMKTVAVPVPGAGQVLLKVGGSSVNPCDSDKVQGYPGCPWDSDGVPGMWE